MAKNSSLKSTGKMIKLIIMMNSKSGTTIPEIMKTLSVSRATAFRMKKAAVEALEGRAEYDFEAFERDDTNEHLFLPGAKELTGKGRDWTYRVYSPGRPLVFNDVGIETIRALKTAHAHLMTGGFLHEAEELTLLLSQVNDRLQNRAGTGAPAEAVLEASGIGTRVSQRVQAIQPGVRARPPVDTEPSKTGPGRFPIMSIAIISARQPSPMLILPCSMFHGTSATHRTP